MTHSRTTYLTLWLSLVALLVVAVVVVGGITRLTDSGLSMVEWKPLMGVLPPLNSHEWQEVFSKYQQYPEYQIHNQGMSLDEFKSIFLWEYSHRILGRIIGLVFVVPFIFFWLRGYFSRKLFWQLGVGLLLGGSQGLLGWFMVQSGLADMPDVSHYRLAAHLSLALIIFASLLWLILSINSHEESERKSSVSRGTVALSLLVVIQILYGAFIAGKKAGLGINTFPTMNGEWIPSSLFALKPIWLNFFDNNVTLQFIHRWLALGILVSVAFFIHSHWKISSGSPLRKALVLLLGATLAQCILGITTLIFIIPLPLAILHQLGGVFMVFALVYLAHTETHHRRSHLNETYKTPPISSKTCLGNSL